MQSEQVDRLEVIKISKIINNLKKLLFCSLQFVHNVVKDELLAYEAYIEYFIRLHQNP